MSIFETAQWYLAIAWKHLKAFLRRRNTNIRFFLGYIAPGLTVVSIPYNKMTLTLRADGWLLFSDGSSTDAVPLHWAQPNYVEAIVTAMGYDPKKVIEYHG
uniref:Uncharacterized protein n=1 Tax=Pseudomonas phage Cygsa01 TaxID=3138529 RepID=A0AAU6W507_9VIRU